MCVLVVVWVKTGKALFFTFWWSLEVPWWVMVPWFQGSGRVYITIYWTSNNGTQLNMALWQWDSVYDLAEVNIRVPISWLKDHVNILINLSIKQTSHWSELLSINSSPPWKIWLPFSRQQIKMHFLVWNVLYFDSNVTEVHFFRSNWQ